MQLAAGDDVDLEEFKSLEQASVELAHGSERSIGRQRQGSLLSHRVHEEFQHNTSFLMQDTLFDDANGPVRQQPDTPQLVSKTRSHVRIACLDQDHGLAVNLYDRSRGSAKDISKPGQPMTRKLS